MEEAWLDQELNGYAPSQETLRHPRSCHQERSLSRHQIARKVPWRYCAYNQRFSQVRSASNQANGKRTRSSTHLCGGDGKHTQQRCKGNLSKEPNLWKWRLGWCHSLLQNTSEKSACIGQIVRCDNSGVSESRFKFGERRGQGRSQDKTDFWNAG